MVLGDGVGRVHNIVVAAEKFAGLVTPPGKLFGFHEGIEMRALKILEHEERNSHTAVPKRKRYPLQSSSVNSRVPHGWLATFLMMGTPRAR